LLGRLVAGNCSDGGALREIAVPLGFAVSCHFISKAHSMVLPATTEPSFATILTAVHAELNRGENARVTKTEAAIIFVIIVCFTIIFLDRLIGYPWIGSPVTGLRVAVNSLSAFHVTSSAKDISKRCDDIFDCNAHTKFSTDPLENPNSGGAWAKFKKAALTHRPLTRKP
jgi:hypothetical protein